MWSPDQAEASPPRVLQAVFTTNGKQPWGAGREGEDWCHLPPLGGRDVASSITLLTSPALCCGPERAPDILVGVGLGCLLQMTSGQLVVKVRLQRPGGTGQAGSRTPVSLPITPHLSGSWSLTASWSGSSPGPWG